MTEGKDEELKFQDALAELERIVAAIEDEDVDLDELAERVDRAATLIQFCRERIDTTQSRVRRIIDGLESSSTPEGRRDEGEG